MLDPSFQRTLWYDEEAVEDRLLPAYRSLFPTLNEDLLAYWNFDRNPRHKLLPHLTTNFHEVTYRQLRMLSDAVLDIEQTEFDVQKRAAKLIEQTRSGPGLSIGISPWTDHALFETWRPEKRRLVILLGHDWYPISSKNKLGFDHPSDVPLSQVGLSRTPTYAYAVPEELSRCSPVLLFLNLIPDLRQAGDTKTGRLRGYRDWARGFDAVVKSLIELDHFATIQILSWGAHNWESLWPRLSEGAGSKIKAWAAGPGHGRVIDYLCAGKRIPFFATVHPSYQSNWNKEHARSGFIELGLG